RRLVGEIELHRLALLGLRHHGVAIDFLDGAAQAHRLRRLRLCRSGEEHNDEHAGRKLPCKHGKGLLFSSHRPGYMGGAAPSRPTFTAGATTVPSGCFWTAMMISCAPAFMSAALPGTNLTTGVLGGTMTFFSPSAYFTIKVWPSTPATVEVTSALVMVLPGSRSHELKRAGTTPCWLSMKICRPMAFWLPSGCGIAVTPMKVPVLMSSSEALTIAVMRGLSASFTLTVLPLRSLTVSAEPSTFSMVPRMRTGGGGDPGGAICCACAAAAET